MANYKAHVNENGLVAFHVFVEKPFIGPPPEKEEHSYFLEIRAVVYLFP